MTIAIPSHHHLLAGGAQPAGKLFAEQTVRVVQRVLAHQPVQIQHQLRGQRLLPQLPDALHRQEVVEDHPLGAVPERSWGGRRLRIIALATSRVVAAPSICEEVIASSISELNR
jgi:hypothetical protein